MAEHHGDGQIVVEGAIGLVRQREAARAHLHAGGDRDHARHDDQEREQHLRNGGDEGHAARGRHRMRGHGALHDQEIGAPVAEGQHEAESHHDPEPLDAHGIGRGVAHLAPGARPCPRGEALRRRHVRQPFGESLPAPQILEAEEHQRRETGDDEEELQHLVVDGRGESSEQDIAQHDGRGQPHARVEVPTQEQIQQQSHGVHRDARGENRHGRERDRVQAAGLLVEAHLQVLGHRARLRAVVERHHEDPEKHHRGNRAHPVEMAGRHAVLGPRGGHADHFLRAEVGGEECEPRDPRGNRAAGEKIIRAGLHVAPQREADAQHEGEVHAHDDPVDLAWMHESPLSYLSTAAPGCAAGRGRRHSSTLR